MRTSRFQVLSQGEIDRIHAASMEILGTVGVRVGYQTARDLFRHAGAAVDDDRNCVQLPERLVLWAAEQAPKRFTLYGSDSDFRMEIGGGEPSFAGLGTPTHIIDTGDRASAGRPPWTDVLRHIQLDQRLRPHPQLTDGCLAQRHPHDHHPH